VTPDTRPRRALYLTDGVEDPRLVERLTHLARHGWSPSVICTEVSANRMLGRLDGHAEEVWVLGELMAGCHYPEFILGFIASRGVDLVHLGNSRLGLELMPDISVLPNAPALVVQLDEPKPGDCDYAPYVGERFAPLVDALIADGPGVVERLRGSDVPESRLHVILPHAGGAGSATAELYRRLLERRTAAPAPSPPEPLPSLKLPRGGHTERRISVIVTCCDLGRYLSRAIASLREQTQPPDEVIVVDDGSREEETLEALDALARDDFVQLIRLSGNRGPGAARNVAIARAGGNYVLPLDADDELLPNALEEMSAQLEQAPEEVGFVYAFPQHTGTRTDRVTPPPYNLALLRQANYCVSSCLFDSRVFGAGVRYPWDRRGHEDWDLLLTLAERGVHGIPAANPTLLYRKRGFSRLSTRALEHETPEELARRRHPALYDPRNPIKAKWAPALSLILVGTWPNDFRAATQTCLDFEAVVGSQGPRAVGAATRVVDGAPEDPGWLAEAVAAARGRWVAVLAHDAASALESPQFVELVLRAFWFSGRLGALALATGANAPFRFAQLAPPLCESVRPVAVAWERYADAPGEEVELGLTGDVIEDLLFELQASREVQWRAIA
jgi:hypothetical protein